MEILNIKYEQYAVSVLIVIFGSSLGFAFLFAFIESVILREKVLCIASLCAVMIFIGVIILGCDLPRDVYYECTINDISVIENDWQIVKRRGKIFVLEKTNSDAEAPISNDELIYNQQEKLK